MRIGLTGGVASGKSLVAGLLAEWGAVIIDADLLARWAVAPGTPGLQSVADEFGGDVFADDGSLDRPALGALVFADEQARRRLEAIIHPEVRRLAAELEDDAADGSVVVHVIPLLVETGQHDDFDLLVVVDAPPELQLERLMARNDLDEAAATARLAAQATRQQRLDVADWVIDNGGSVRDTERQVDLLWGALR